MALPPPAALHSPQLGLGAQLQLPCWSISAGLGKSSAPSPAWKYHQRSSNKKSNSCISLAPWYWWRMHLSLPSHLPFPPKSCEGSMGFSVTQENQKQKQTKNILEGERALPFTHFTFVLGVKGVIWILTKGLCRRWTLTLVESKGNEASAKTTPKKVTEVPDSDLFSGLQEHKQQQVKSVAFYASFV